MKHFIFTNKLQNYTKNILNFERDFDNSNIIRLEQNYRSTGNILKTASSIISENTERIGKKLWTTDKDGDPVLIRNFEDDDFEAIFQNRNRIKIDFYQSPESSKNRNRKKLTFLTPNLIEIEL